MPTYRFYCLDGTGKLHDAEWFEADSDEQAVATIQARHPNDKCEVWRGDRLIGPPVTRSSRTHRTYT
jgi:hypothetical protein